MTATYGRSPLEIAEDRVLQMAQPRFNVSRADAQRLCIQIKEIAKPQREKAAALLDNWTGSQEQINAAMDLYPVWVHAATRMHA